MIIVVLSLFLLLHVLKNGDLYQLAVAQSHMGYARTLRIDDRGLSDSSAAEEYNLDSSFSSLEAEQPRRSYIPSKTPTLFPTKNPTRFPTSFPSKHPTLKPTSKYEYGDIFITLYVPALTIADETITDPGRIFSSPNQNGNNNDNANANDEGSNDAESNNALWDILKSKLKAAFVDPNNSLTIKRCMDPSTASRSDIPNTIPLASDDQCIINRKISNYDKYNSDQIQYKVEIVINMALPLVFKSTEYPDIDTQLNGYQILKIVLEKVLDKYTNGLSDVLHMIPPVRISSDPRPNILFLLADDMGYGDVGYQACSKSSTDNPCTSKSITPNIDALATGPSSIIFSRFYSHTQCTPSRASILTGLDPARLCMLTNPYARNNDDPVNLPITTITVADAAKQSGYQTMFIGKWHVGVIKEKRKKVSASTPGDNGFMEWYATKRSTSNNYPNCGCFKGQDICDVGMYNTSYCLFEYSATNQFSQNKYMIDKKTFICEPYFYDLDGNFDPEDLAQGVWNAPIVDGTGFVVQRFSEFLERHYSLASPSRILKEASNKEERKLTEAVKPFFAALWFHAPHAPYIGSQKFREIAIKEVEKEMLRDGDIYCGTVFDKYNILQNGRPICSTRFSKQYCKGMCIKIRTEYYAAILALDEGIGNVLKLLDDYGQRENTFIVFSSDNGPARFDTSGSGVRYVAPGSTSGYPGYKFQVREGGLRVPGFISFPKLIKQNRIIKNSPVGNVDLFATALTLFDSNSKVLSMLKDVPLDGMSLVPYLFGVESKRKKPLGYASKDVHRYMIFEEMSLRTTDITTVTYFNGLAPPESSEVAVQQRPYSSSGDAYIRSFRAWNNDVTVKC